MCAHKAYSVKKCSTFSAIAKKKCNRRKWLVLMRDRETEREKLKIVIHCLVAHFSSNPKKKYQTQQTIPSTMKHQIDNRKLRDMAKKNDIVTLIVVWNVLLNSWMVEYSPLQALGSSLLSEQSGIPLQYLDNGMHVPFGHFHSDTLPINSVKSKCEKKRKCERKKKSWSKPKILTIN